MSTLLDRVVHWNLDLDGDLYGDERERYRWYEGIATAASMQWLLIPWAAAIMVWPLGRSSVIPLGVVLVLMWVPIQICAAYVKRRRVDTAPRDLRPRRIVLGVLSGIPFAIFLIGAIYAYDPDGFAWRGAAFGAVFGGLAGVVAMVVEVRRRRRRDALALDED